MNEVMKTKVGSLFFLFYLDEQLTINNWLFIHAAIVSQFRPKQNNSQLII